MRLTSAATVSAGSMVQQRSSLTFVRHMQVINGQATVNAQVAEFESGAALSNCSVPCCEDTVHHVKPATQHAGNGVWLITHAGLNHPVNFCCTISNRAVIEQKLFYSVTVRCYAEATIDAEFAWALDLKDTLRDSTKLSAWISDNCEVAQVTMCDM
jgi:hypothetical protein